jgi:hypothetical protein
MCFVSAGVFLLGEGSGAPGTHFQIWERENKKVGHPPLVSIADDAHVLSFRADGRFWYGCVYGWCFNTNLHERCDPPVVMFGWFGHPIDRAQVLAFGKKTGCSSLAVVDNCRLYAAWYINCFYGCYLEQSSGGTVKGFMIRVGGRALPHHFAGCPTEPSNNQRPPCGDLRLFRFS